ncbi:MAG: glycosyltransferase family A protein [Bacteroidales bacterium]
MNKSQHPVVVIAAFNRPESIRRILRSVNLAIYAHPVKLIISIDNNGQNQEVYEIADNFKWKHGEKEVIYHQERQGLRKHIISCGNLACEYGAAIVLEDDLFVSPHYYQYAVKALEFYENDPLISGISLYNLPFVESNKLPFIPLEDDSDVYFIQMAASYGQMWTKTQWEGFRKWYDQAPDLSNITGLPGRIRNWPESSWKKYFIGYLISSSTYFVFPRKSYTTNFNDPGENMISRSLYVQVPLQIVAREPKFISLKKAINVYDAYAELLPECLNQLTDRLKEFDMEIDLYGRKESFTKPYVLTSRPVKNYIYQYEKSMKPHEMNVVMDIRGQDISLAKREDVIMDPQKMKAFLNEYAYFYTSIFMTGMLIKILKFRLKNKIKTFFQSFISRR